MVAQTRKIKADCGVEPGASSPPPAIAQAELYRATRMPALPTMPSISSPKVTSTLVNTDVLAEGLKKFAGRDLAPYVLQVDDADSSTSIGGYREPAAVLDAAAVVAETRRHCTVTAKSLPLRSSTLMQTMSSAVGRIRIGPGRGKVVVGQFTAARAGEGG